MSVFSNLAVQHSVAGSPASSPDAGPRSSGARSPTDPLNSSTRRSPGQPAQRSERGFSPRALRNSSRSPPALGPQPPPSPPRPAPPASPTRSGVPPLVVSPPDTAAAAPGGRPPLAPPGHSSPLNEEHRQQQQRGKRLPPLLSAAQCAGPLPSPALAGLPAAARQELLGLARDCPGALPAAAACAQGLVALRQQHPGAAGRVLRALLAAHDAAGCSAEGGSAAALPAVGQLLLLGAVSPEHYSSALGAEDPVPLPPAQRPQAEGEPRAQHRGSSEASERPPPAAFARRWSDGSDASLLSRYSAAEAGRNPLRRVSNVTITVPPDPIPDAAPPDPWRGSVTLPAQQLSFYGGLAPAASPVAIGGSASRAAYSARRTQMMSGLDFARLREQFDEIDTDGSGSLSRYELRVLWRSLFPDLRAKEVRQLADDTFDSIDYDESGTIAFEELSTYLRQGAPGQGSALVDVAQTTERPQGWREWLWALVEEPASQMYRLAWLRTTSICLSYFAQAVIVLSVVNLVVESVPSIEAEGGGQGTPTTRGIELSCMIFFTVEFALRLAPCPAVLRWDPATQGPPRLITQRQFWLMGFTWIDLLAILPNWVLIAVSSGGDSNAVGAPFLVVRVLRLVRLVRVARVLKLGRHSQGVELMLLAIQRATLALLWMCMLLAMSVSIFACLMFTVETKDGGPRFDVPTETWVRDTASGSCKAGPVPYQSIPDAMWWTIVTLTTVGYGDMYPCTAAGRFVAAVAMIAGIILLAYPLTILGRTYSEVYQEFEDKKRATRRRLTLAKAFAAQQAAPVSPLPSGIVGAVSFPPSSPLQSEPRRVDTVAAAGEFRKCPSWCSSPQQRSGGTGAAEWFEAPSSLAATTVATSVGATQSDPSAPGDPSGGPYSVPPRHPGELWRCVYVSRAAAGMRADDVSAMVQAARQRNSASGLTALLVWAPPLFLQTVEGPREKVVALLAALRRDARHESLQVLAEGSVSRRCCVGTPLHFVPEQPCAPAAFVEQAVHAVAQQVAEGDWLRVQCNAADLGRLRAVSPDGS